MRRYPFVSKSINPDPLAPGARLAVVVLTRVRRSLTSSLTAAEARAGRVLIRVGVLIMLCVLLALFDPSLALWLGGLAAVASGGSQSMSIAQAAA